MAAQVDISIGSTHHANLEQLEHRRTLNSVIVAGNVNAKRKLADADVFGSTAGRRPGIFLEPQASGVFGVKLSTLYLILFAAAQRFRDTRFWPTILTPRPATTPLSHISFAFPRLLLLLPFLVLF